ncbi:MAG: toll/interleukin-1 receptor domain-containing protein [Sphingomicrobium sp.]
MAKVARLPANDRVPKARAKPRKRRRAQTRYFAFLSYSHRDEELADWLHRELEDFHVPTALAGKLTANGIVPKRLAPIFRDEHELAAADDLGEEISAALAASNFLIVLCTPSAATSHWTNAEIETFKRARPDGCVLAVIGGGEPFASDIAERADEECFPPALRERYDKRGRPTGQRAEPLAADLRGGADDRRMGFLKLVAGMLGVGLDDLVKRENTRRQRRLAWLSAASLSGMAITSMLAIAAIQARDSARDQRREAEGLVAFMLGDLKDKLEPIGRLDALDGVGTKVLDYYRKQDAADLPDNALLQRSRALSLSAQVAMLRGNVDNAQKLYGEALAGTAEAIRRQPNDPQRLYDHAQNVFWVGEIARQMGDSKTAEASARDYGEMAARMVRLDPDNIRWRMEKQNAEVELGVVLYEQRRFAEAQEQFTRGLGTIQALATADPGNGAFQQSVADTLAWLADSMMSQGRFADAIQRREYHVALLERLSARSRGDVAYRQRLVPAQRALANLYAFGGDLTGAIRTLQAAVAGADELVGIEGSNRQWAATAAAARLNLADVLLAANRSGDAALQITSACAAVAKLGQAASPATRDCQMLRAKLALTTGGTAVVPAQAAVAAARLVQSGDRLADRFMLAKAYRLLGDARARGGDAGDARVAWQAAANTLPAVAAERPGEIAERATIFERNGKAAEAAKLGAQLHELGYKLRSV